MPEKGRLTPGNQPEAGQESLSLQGLQVKQTILLFICLGKHLGKKNSQIAINLYRSLRLECEHPQTYNNQSLAFFHV